MITFHFIRAYGLLLLFPLLVFAWYRRQHQTSHTQWKAVCDEHLLPHLIEEQSLSQSPFYIYLIISLLLVFAISGPTWRELPTPVFRNINTRVFILGMGPSLYAQDLKPSRLVRARYKLIDLLKQSHEGQTGLIVSGEAPYVVAPLTEDTNTLINLVPVLEPALLPNSSVVIQLHFALKEAENLIHQAGQTEANIIVITDQNASAEAVSLAKTLHNKKINISVMAVGTKQGAPIPLPQGGFLKDSSGNMVIAKLETSQLKALAKVGGGQFVTIDLSNADVDKLLNSQIKSKGQKQKSNQVARLWKDEGAWFIFCILPFVLMAFRRGYFDSNVGRMI